MHIAIYYAAGTAEAKSLIEDHFQIDEAPSAAFKRRSYFCQKAVLFLGFPSGIIR